MMFLTISQLMKKCGTHPETNFQNYDLLRNSDDLVVSNLY